MRAKADGSRVVFLRHSESEANVRHRLANQVCLGLSPRGRDDARLLAKRVAALGPTRIVSSPLRRARETADELASAVRPAVEESALLTEVDVGRLEGREDAAAWTVYHSVVQGWAWGDSTLSFPGGESLVDIRLRLVSFVDEVMSAAASGDVVVAVSHGELLRAALPAVLANMSDAASGYWIDNGGAVSCEIRRGEFVCVEWNGRALSQR